LVAWGGIEPPTRGFSICQETKENQARVKVCDLQTVLIWRDQNPPAAPTRALVCRSMAGASMRRLCWALVAFALSFPAMGETAGEMLSACRPWVTAPLVEDGSVVFPEGELPQRCWGAFSAIQTGISWTDTTGHPFWGVCAPPTSRRTQLIAIFVQYASNLPARWHEDFMLLAVESLRRSFPCR
jgi:hypothetical protein